MICNGCDGICKDCAVEDNTSVPICTVTFAHADSGGGAATIEELNIVEGFWRATNTSQNVLPCHNADACHGGITGDPTYCVTGYEGPCEISTTVLFISAHDRIHTNVRILTERLQPHCSTCTTCCLANRASAGTVGPLMTKGTTGVVCTDRVT